MNARQFRTALREDRLFIGGVVVVCVLIAAAVGLLVPRPYTSSAIYYVNAPVAAPNSAAAQGAPLSAERVSSYAELIAGPRVAADASTLLGGNPSAAEIQRSVTSEAVPDTVVLNVEVSRPSPEEAQRVGNAVTVAFSRLVARIESTPGTGAPASVDLIYPPTSPTAPDGPGLPLLLLLGLVVGAVLGTVLAWLRRAARPTLDRPEVVTELIDAPVLASLPGLSRAPRRPALLQTVPSGAKGRTATRLRARGLAVRQLRSGVMSSEAQCVLITGARSGQGTTTAAVDLAVALGAAGNSVVLVDAGARGPGVAGLLGLPGSPGVVESLDGGAPAVARWAPGATDVLPAGAPQGRPNDLWGLPESARLLTRLREEYRWVVLDAGPVGTEPDVLDLARLADVAVLVVRRGSARVEDLESAVAALRVVGVPLIGAAFTWAGDRTGPVFDAPLALPPGNAVAHVTAERAPSSTAASADPPVTVDAVDVPEVRDAVHREDASPEPAVVPGEPVGTAMDLPPLIPTPEPDDEAAAATNGHVVTATTTASPIPEPAPEPTPEPSSPEPISPEPAVATSEPSATSTSEPSSPEPASVQPTELRSPDPTPEVPTPAPVTGLITPGPKSGPVATELSEPSEPSKYSEPSEPVEAEPVADEPPDPAPVARRRKRRRVTSSWPSTTAHSEPNGHVERIVVGLPAEPDPVETAPVRADAADNRPDDDAASEPATPDETPVDEDHAVPARRVYVPGPGRNGHRRALASRLTPRKS